MERLIVCVCIGLRYYPLLSSCLTFDINVAICYRSIQFGFCFGLVWFEVYYSQFLTFKNSKVTDQKDHNWKNRDFDFLFFPLFWNFCYPFGNNNNNNNDNIYLYVCIVLFDWPFSFFIYIYFFIYLFSLFLDNCLSIPIWFFLIFQYNCCFIGQRHSIVWFSSLWKNKKSNEHFKFVNHFEVKTLVYLFVRCTYYNCSSTVIPKVGAIVP